MVKVFTPQAAVCYLFAFLTASPFVKSYASCPAWHKCKNGGDGNAIFHYTKSVCDILHFVAVAARGSPNLYFNNVMSNVNVKLLCKPYDLLEGIGMNTRSHDIFIDTFEFFCRLNSTLRNFILHLLSVQTLCIFPCKPALPLHLIPCCTGAEHYVNLVIGTGPSPLYGFLLSRST